MDINITNDSGLIDDKEGTFAETFRAQHTVQFGNFSVRPEITEERIVNPSHAFSPGDQTIGGVNTYTQNLGIQSREFGCISLVERDLLTSYRRPGEGEESEDHVFAAIGTERDRFLKV